MTHQLVAVLGAGTMGVGISRMLLESGAGVVLSDVDPAALEAARRKLVSVAGSWPADWADRFTVAHDVAAVDACDVVVDATPQGTARKSAVLREVARRTGSGVLVGTVTLGTPLAELDAAGDLPDRLLGLHFMNPPHALRFCEVVVRPGLDPRLLERAQGLLTSMRVRTIEVQDTNGFVLNRALVPFLFTAVRMLEDGIAGPVDIDRAFVEGCAHPMGPLAILDLIGLDVAIELGEQLVPTAGEACRPPQLLYQLLAEGRRLHDVDGATVVRPA
jgi:3-hydroxybutyryl-CoA dehydrogenase